MRRKIPFFYLIFCCCCLPFERLERERERKKWNCVRILVTFSLLHCAAERKEQGQSILELTVCITETRYCRFSCNYVYFIHIICTRHTKCTLCISNGAVKRRDERERDRAKWEKEMKREIEREHRKLQQHCKHWNCVNKTMRWEE